MRLLAPLAVLFSRLGAAFAQEEGGTCSAAACPDATGPPDAQESAPAAGAVDLGLVQIMMSRPERRRAHALTDAGRRALAPRPRQQPRATRIPRRGEGLLEEWQVRMPRARSVLEDLLRRRRQEALEELRARTRDTPFFKVLDGRPGDDGRVVIGADQAEPLGVLGWEGSFYTQDSNGTYHYLSAGRLPHPGGWSYAEQNVHMRFDHWQSSDGSNWTRTRKIWESDGNFNGTDRRASTWAPMAAYDPEAQRWHLFYVAYRASPDYKRASERHAYDQWDGEIWHAVSEVQGESGIGGPYRDVGAVLNEEGKGGPEDKWEGDQGTSMFFPYRLDNGTWAALYGSEFGRYPNFCEPACREVGLVTADTAGLDGKWRRDSRLNPLDGGFRPAQPGIENPVVVKTQDGKWFVAVYHIYSGATIGVSFSKDGVTWHRQAGDIALGEGFCGGTVTTACGLVAEPSRGKGVYSLLYTASGSCSEAQCAMESVCRAYLVNQAEAEGGE